jgi:hypothetical protein
MSKPTTILGLFVNTSGAWERNVSLDFALSAMDDIAFSVTDTGTSVFFHDFNGEELAFWHPNDV